jgi:hypothetical protein
MTHRKPEHADSHAAGDPAGDPGKSPGGFGHVRSRNVKLRTNPPDDSKFAARIAELQQQMQDKEEVILTLTSRLEQAAEQLDRLRRCGNNAPTRRGGGGGGSGMPSDLLDDHKSAIDDLKQVIGRWEEMQCEATLGRLESQVSELRDLLTGMVGGGHVSAGSHPFPASPAAPHAAPADKEKKSGGSWWEATKAAMLSGEEPPPPPANSVRESTPSYASSSEDNAPADAAYIPPLPEMLDYDELTLDTANVALRERDQLLLRYRELLLAQQAAREFAHVASLEDLPDALRERLQKIETDWQAKFRQMELDCSRERARLARSEASLRQQQELIQKELNRLGLEHNADTAAANGPAGDEEPRRRWFKFLGKKDS